MAFFSRCSTNFSLPPLTAATTKTVLKKYFSSRGGGGQRLAKVVNFSAKVFVAEILSGIMS